MQKDHQKNKENTEKLQAKYKEKVEKYKAKIVDLKARIADKEKDIREVTRTADEDRIIQEKNIEILQLKLQEQKEHFENRLLHQEEENHSRMVRSFPKNPLFNHTLS